MYIHTRYISLLHIKTCMHAYVLVSFLYVLINQLLRRNTMVLTVTYMDKKAYIYAYYLLIYK